MAKSTSPHNGSGVLSALQEFTAEFDLDEEGQVIEVPALPSGASHKAVPDHTAVSSVQPFTAEIESLRIALQRLQLAFSCTTAIEDHHQLASTISLITASISRLVRAQNYLVSNRPVEFNREMYADLAVVLKEWGQTG